MRRLLTASLLLALGGCAADTMVTDPGELPFTKVDPGKADTSAEAVFLDFTSDSTRSSS